MPSAMFSQYFTRGTVDYVGRCSRRGRMKAQECANSSFERFCEVKGLTIPTEYRKVKPNMDASFKSVSKYDKLQPTVNEASWLLAGEWTKCHFQPFMGGSGILATCDVVSELDKTTSAGYPWNTKFLSKAEFLEDSTAHGVFEEYWSRLAMPDNTIVPIWTCSQKIELRSVEKIAQNKIRTFTAAPIEHTVCANRLFLDMNNKFYASHGDTWSSVGMTKFFRGWDTLYRRLDVHPDAFALDESEYDSSIFARAMREQGDIRFSFLAEEFRTPDIKERVSQVYSAIVHSVIVLENGDLVVKHTGNPSGSSNTIVDNTMILFRLKAYSWIELCVENGFEPTYATFMEFVEAALCGDDNTFTVSAEVSSWYNATSISRVWSSLGITTTTPVYEPRKLHETQFLSQGFRFDERLNIWMPEPETARVLSSIMWGSPVDDVRWHYLRACALRMDSYGNLECKSTLEAYIDFLNQQYRDFLHGVIQVGRSPPISMRMIRTAWKSDFFLDALYSGKESGGMQKNFRTTLEIFSTLCNAEREEEEDEAIQTEESTC